MQNKQSESYTYLILNFFSDNMEPLLKMLWFAAHSRKRLGWGQFNTSKEMKGKKNISHILSWFWASNKIKNVFYFKQVIVIIWYKSNIHKKLSDFHSDSKCLGKWFKCSNKVLQRIDLHNSPSTVLNIKWFKGFEAVSGRNRPRENEEMLFWNSCCFVWR